jgi:ribonuclease Z
MAIEWKVLGRAGADNALHVVVDSGQARESLLFDCGERCLDELRPSAAQAVSHLCFSHFHMDHVAGFDGFFRLNYNRPEVPVGVWGPPGTIEVMGHRFAGFVWNLHRDQPGEWIVREIAPKTIGTARFLTREAFSPAHRQPDRPPEGPIVHRARDWRLEARLLPHGTIPSVAYRVVESPRRNIDAAALRRYDYLPGAWLQAVAAESTADAELVEVAGRALRVGELRQELLVTSPGDSIAWLTDFRVEPGTEDWAALVAWLAGTGTIVCECQYRAADSVLAAANAHMTADLVGRLAAEAGAGRLVLQHLSRRYAVADWLAMRDEAATAFPRAELPPEWNLRP